VLRRFSESLRVQLTVVGAGIAALTAVSIASAARFAALPVAQLDATWLIACAALLAGAVSYVIAGLAERPLRRIALATQHVGTPEFQLRKAGLPRGDEFAEISSALVALDRALVAKGNEVLAANCDSLSTRRSRPSAHATTSCRVSLTNSARRSRASGRSPRSSFTIRTRRARRKTSSSGSSWRRPNASPIS
jgi:hypothetical protein